MAEAPRLFGREPFGPRVRQQAAMQRKGGNEKSTHELVAAADLERQARAKKIDPSWFHRAKTALRHLQRERAELLATAPAAATRKAALKDAIIEVVRREHDDASWAAVLNEAHRLAAGEG